MEHFTLKLIPINLYKSENCTYFEENKPINPCSHCDDKENIGKVSSIEQQEFKNSL